MNTKTNHTPGKWIVRVDPSDESPNVYSESHHANIARVNPVMTACHANGILLASAPDLLAACEWMVKAPNDGLALTAAFEAARAAIKKAKGGV